MGTRRRPVFKMTNVAPSLGAKSATAMRTLGLTYALSCLSPSEWGPFLFALKSLAAAYTLMPFRARRTESLSDILVQTGKDG